MTKSLIEGDVLDRRENVLAFAGGSQIVTSPLLSTEDKICVARAGAQFCPVCPHLPANRTK